MKILYSVIAVLFLTIILLSVDKGFGKPVQFTGKLIDKHYSNSTVSVGTGVGIDPYGRSVVVTTTQIKPEEWILIIRKQDGQIVSVNCSDSIFYSKAINENIDFITYYGLIFGCEYNSEIQ